MSSDGPFSAPHPGTTAVAAVPFMNGHALARSHSRLSPQRLSVRVSRAMAPSFARRRSLRATPRRRTFTNGT